MKFILLEKVFTDSATGRSRAVHYSINSWVRSMALALSVEHDVTLVGHKHDPYFPKGSVLPGRESELDERFEQRLLKYINLPLARHWCLERVYLKSLSQLAEDSSEDIVIISFCNNYAINDALKALRKKHRCKVFNLVLDWPTPAVDWDWYASKYSSYDGHVFISKWCTDNFTVAPAYHFEGFLPHEPEFAVTEGVFKNKTLLYTGKFDPAGGLDLFLDVFSKCGREDIRLLITTPIPTSNSGDSNVEYLGMLNESELDEIMRSATAFLSPYLPDHRSNLSRFPSKSLKYMAYSKPILSTLTPGCSEAYRSYVSNFDIDSVNSLSSALGRIYDCSYQEYVDNCRRNYELLQGGYSNQGRIAGLIEWIDSLG